MAIVSSAQGPTRSVAAGLAYTVLAVAQLAFAYLSSIVVTVVSQTDWYRIDWRWILPWLALASCAVFVRLAWRCFRP